LLTIQDDLTKLSNSRHLNHCLEAEVSQAKRKGADLSLIFLDLDGFKAVNDNYGHLVGSQTLVDIGNIIREVSRPDDIAGRYGGDEFMLIMPDTSLDEAVRMGEVIRDRVAGYRMREMQMTASIGISSYPRHTEDKDQMIRMADKAMYRVKDKGKNGILCAHEV